MSEKNYILSIYKNVTYKDVLSYKRYKKLSFLKGYSPEEIAKHLYAQKEISQDKWKALKILSRKLFNEKRAEAHKTIIHNRYDYLLDDFNNRRLPNGIFSKSFDRGVCACVKAKSDLPFYEHFFSDYFLKFNIDSIIDYAYTLPEDQKDMCKTLILSSIQYYRDTNEYRGNSQNGHQYIELSDVYTNIRFKHDVWYDNAKAVDFLIEHYHDRIINASLKMTGSLTYESKINYLRRTNPDFDAKQEKNRFKHLVAMARDKMYNPGLNINEVGFHKGIVDINKNIANEDKTFSVNRCESPTEKSNEKLKEETHSNPVIEENKKDFSIQNMDKPMKTEAVQTDFSYSDISAKEVRLNIVSKTNNSISVTEKKGNIRPKEGIDYSEKQKNNQEIGDIGEDFVLANEIDKAKKWGLAAELVSQIRRVSLESDDYGFDILSFDKNGKKHYIEVKTTTSSSNNLSFVLTQNELEHSKEYGESYSIVMVLDVLKEPRIWDMGNPFVQEPYKVNIKPIKYLVSFSTNTVD